MKFQFMRASLKILYGITFLILIHIKHTFAQAEQTDSSLFYIKKGAKEFYSSDFANTEKSWKKALEMRLQVYNSKSIVVGHAYNNLGVLYLNTWNFEKAEHYLNQAKEIYVLNNKKVHISNVNSNLGANHRLQGNLLLAEEYFVIALENIKNLHTKDAKQRKSEILNRLGMLEISQKNYRKACDYYNFALNNYYEEIPDHVRLNLFENLAKSYLHTRIDSANIILDKALILAHEVNFLNNNFLSNIYSLYAKYYELMFEKEKAYNYLKKSEKILNSFEIDSTVLFNIYDNYSDFYIFFGEYNLAIEYIQKSLQLLTKQKVIGKLNTPSSENYINPILGIKVLRTKADLLIKLYKKKGNGLYLEEAINAMLVASDLVDQSRNSFLSVESKLALAENESAIYQIGIYAAAILYRQTKDPKYLSQAFLFSEKSKSSVLEGTLQEQKAKTFGNIPDSLLKKEEEYKRNIAFYKELLHTEKSNHTPDTSRLRNFQSIEFDFTEKHEKLKNQLEKLYPSYYSLKYKSNQSSIEDLQQAISNSTTVLEYTLTDSVLYIFQIDKKNAELFTHKVEQNDFDILSDYLQDFKTFHYLKQSTGIFSDYENKAFTIYQKLIGSANPEAINKNLIIIPDNILSYIPFEALAQSKNEHAPSSYLDIDYLNDHYSTFYSYSANLLLETSKDKKLKLSNPALTIAPEYGQSGSSLLANNKPFLANSRSSLSPLPFAKEEAELVSRVTGGTNLLGHEATEEKFILASPDYQILHLAMHTLIDDKNPLFSKLVFSSDSLESGFLTTNEIFSLKLNAKMTVLSACSSGEGELNNGEGVLSLARSFFYAGCPSLVMTLWNVDDNAGLSLMHYYYKYLKRGYSKPRAMQLAKKSYLSEVPPEKQHPFYWANYICIGNPAPMYFSRWHLIILLFIMVTAVLAIIKVTKRKNKPIPLVEPSPGSLGQT